MKEKLNKKKVLYIDPWGIRNTADYAWGMVRELSKLCRLEVIENSRCEFPEDQNYLIRKWFFPFSQKINSGTIRKPLRGVEYIYCWIRISYLILRGRYDVVHFNWLLLYKIDAFFLKLLRPFCKKIIYTAHNVLPHINGEKYFDDLKRIYSLVDVIVVHGHNIQEEFGRLYPMYVKKTYVQYHGFNAANIESKPSQSATLKLPQIKKTIDFSVYKKILLCMGQLYAEKGIDRVVMYWKKRRQLLSRKKCLIVIVGKRLESDYLKDLSIGLSSDSTLLFIPFYLEDKLLSCVIDNSDCVILPYRHASMSGVIFTCAYHKKTVLCTDAGGISEYLVNREDSFICENNDISLYQSLDDVLNIPRVLLLSQGRRLSQNFVNKFDWEIVINKLVHDVY